MRTQHRHYPASLMHLLKRLLPVIFVLISCTSCFKKSAERAFNRNKENIPYDVIIVPGYPFEDSTWNDVMKIRVYWSYYLYKNGFTKNVIYSGSAVYSPYIEAQIMRLYGLALGIPQENIYTENMAKHSTENLYYSFQLAENKGFKKIALATDPYQSALLARYAKKHNMNIALLPIQFDSLTQMEIPNPVIDPSTAYVPDFVALPEKEGFFERLRGTLGEKIDSTLY